MNLNIHLPDESATVFLGISPNEQIKNYSHVKSITRVFRAALFINRKTLKQPKFPVIWG